MWIFLVEIAGAVTALCGWFVCHSFAALLIGSILMGIFDMLLYTAGGQLKSYGLSLLLLIGGGIVGALSGYGSLTMALLFFAVYSAVVIVMKLILFVLAMLNQE